MADSVSIADINKICEGDLELKAALLDWHREECGNVEQKEERLFYDIAEIPYERKSIERILTGFNDLDYDAKGLEVGITLVVANTNSGKSTLCQGFIARAIEQGYKTWVFSGEHTAKSFLQLLYHQNSQKKDYIPVVYKDRNGKDTNIVDWYITKERESLIRALFSGNLFLYSNKASRDIDKLIESMTACNKEKGTRFYLIDNMISIDNISSNVFAEQTRITEKIRTFALNNNCIVVLVAHQRKLAERGFRIDIQDVAGSQNISNKAYNVIAQYRVDMISKDKKEYQQFTKDLATSGFDIEKCDNILEVLKTKGNGTGLVGLVYDAETKTYRQAEKITATKADKIIRLASKQINVNGLSLEEEPCDEDKLPF